MAEPWEQDWSAPSGNPWEQDWSAPPAAPAMSAKDTAVDAYKGLGTGAIKGTLGLAGMAGDLTDIGAKGIEKASNYLSDKLGVDRYQRPNTPSVLSNIPTTQSLSDRLESALGEKMYQPQSGAGKAAETLGQFIPGALTPGGEGSWLENIARYAVAPAAATVAADKAIGDDNSLKPYMVAGAGAAASLVNPSRLVTPLPASAARQAAVDTLEREGVTSLTAGQRTGNEGLRYMEDAASHAPMAGHGAAHIQAEGQNQFTEAALRRAGADGLATPEVLAANQHRLGQTFNDLSARNTLVPDNQFIGDLTDAVSNYRNVPDSQQRAIVQGYVNDIIPHVNAGGMPGAQYQPMRSKLSQQADATRNSDPYLSQALGGMRNALDGAMNRSMSPADQAAWAEARQQYSAQKVIEKAASRAGEATLEGNIVPANLRNTIAGENRGGYARGQGQFNELARAGAQVMTPLPNSGTAQRMNALHLLNAGLAGIPQALAGRVLMSRPAQSYLSNQLMSGTLPTNQRAQALLIIRALTGK